MSRLQHGPAAAEVVIGGGFALQHYHEYRATHDIDAWWRAAPTVAATKAFI